MSDCARLVAATRGESRYPLAFSAAALSIPIGPSASPVKRDARGMAGTGPIPVSLLRLLCCHRHPPCFGVIGGFGKALQAAMEGGLNLRTLACMCYITSFID